MSTIALLSSSPTYSEASQIIPTVNYVIQQINANVLIGSQAPTSWRNTVIGGDFSTNPWQRATSFTSITNTLTYTADRFWALGGASSSISVSRQTTTPPTGFTAVARFGRASSNSDTTAIQFGYVMTSLDSVPHQGVPFVLSFYARAGANYSAASNVLGVTVGYGTGSDESAANFAAQSWTGFATVQLTGSAGTAITGVTLTTSFQRFVAAGFIPVGATQIGFKFTETPVGTAGSADYVEFAGIQFEKMPQGGVNPTPFENMNAADVRLICMRYFQQIGEPATGAVLQTGLALTTSTGVVPLPLPVPMRTTPTAVALFGVAGTSTWALRSANGTLTGSATGTVHIGGVSNVQVNVTALASGTLVANAPVLLTAAGGTTAPIQITAEL